MIYSSFQDNWMRIEIMHAVAEKYFNLACQAKENASQEKSILDLREYRYEHQESVVVGMIKAWCVVALESLANQILAETLNNRTVAISAIEYPNRIIEKFKLYKKSTSELGKKLIIINDGRENIESIVAIADEISQIRNLIVHDKPYEYNESPDGEVIIKDFRNRGTSEDINHNFSNLIDFYSKCDRINEFFFPKTEIQFFFNKTNNFRGLLNK